MPFLLWIAQIIFTQNSNSQIRYEELADSVRNVFWLEQHKIYDGVSNGVGWYSTMLIVNNFFGFSLFSAKYFRLFLSLVSLLSLAYLLLKYIKLPKAFLPLIMIGLSPTLLFFNSTQTEYALDLQMLPIYLLILTSINLQGKKIWLNVLQTMFFWFLVMVGAMSYPAFVYYVPFFMIPFYWKFKSNADLKYLIFSVVAFLLPLILLFSYLEPVSRNLLIYDEVTKGGLFRGAGTFDLNSDNFIHNLNGIFTDLFVRGNSYHFEVFKADFSDILPALALIFTIILGFKKGFNSFSGKVGFLILVLAILNLVMSSSTFDPSGAPGMRRFTPTLAAIYGLFILSWHGLSNIKFKEIWQKYLVLSLLLIIPIHHILVFPVNLSHLADPSPIKYPIWFTIAETPQKSLDRYVGIAQKEDLKLVCSDVGQPTYCRLSEIYGAVAGTCVWNHLECHKILGYDAKTGQLIPLEPQLWENYQFEH